MTWGNDDAAFMFSDLAPADPEALEARAAYRVLNAWERNGERVPAAVLQEWARGAGRNGRKVMEGIFNRWARLYALAEEVRHGSTTPGGGPS